MATSYPDIFAALAEPFDASDVKMRPSPGGQRLSYITARTAMNRLDEVLGPENWWDNYLPGQNSVMCQLSVRLPDGSIVTKVDAGGYAGMSDQGDDDKSGFSDAFKRAAAKFGVGRYLYKDGIVDYGTGNGHGAANGHKANGHGNPSRPAPADPNGVPTDGRRLFAWLKDREKHYGVALVKSVDEWAKTQGFPWRMVEWDEDQVRAGYDYALASLTENAGSDRTPAPTRGTSAPSRPAPAPPPPVAPPRDPLASRREALTDLTWQHARAISGEKAGNAEFYKSLDGFAAVVEGGEVIESISGCTDADLLDRYIQVAKDQLEFGVKN